MKDRSNPFELLLLQYKNRRKEISQELEALNCSVTQISLIVNAVKEHTDKTLANLDLNLKNERAALGCLEELKESLQDLNAFIIEQPIRIDRGIIEYKAAEKEIIGFENAIRQLQSQYLVEVIEDVPENDKKISKKNKPPRRPGSRPQSLKSTRSLKKSNS